MSSNIFKQHLKYKDKSMNELFVERTEKLSIGQNELRKKWFPEKYNPNLNKKNPFG